MVPDRALRIIAWTVFVACASLSLSGVVLAATGDPGVGSTTAVDVALAIFELLVYVTLGVVGTTVVSRQPRNAVGWIMQLIGTALAISTVANRLYYRWLPDADVVDGFAAQVAWVGSWMWIFAIIPAFTVFALLFPTGRPLSLLWRALGWATVIVGVILFFGTAFVPGPLNEYAAVINPYGIDHPAVKPIGDVAFYLLIPMALASIASVVIRFRRAHGVERQQLKWVATAAALLPVAFSGAGFTSDEGESGYAMLLCGLLIVAVAVGIAMLRYRLYDLDLVINRTLVYGALTATLAAAYAVGVLLLQFVLEPITQDSKLAVAGSTLAVAALFRPARARIQTWVDRRFYRSRYDATRTLTAFSASLRDEVDLDNLGRELRGVVGSAMQPAHVSLWLRER